jgi:hypothetical protein
LAGVKRGNLYVEQGRIGDECLSGALAISGMLLKTEGKLSESREMVTKDAQSRIDTEPGLFYLP